MELSTISWKPGSASTDITTGFLEHEMQFEEFELLYFLDFCSTLDTCVLHEHLYNIDGSAAEKRYMGNPFTKELFSSGAISIVDLPYDNEYVVGHAASIDLMKAIPSGFQLDEIDLWTENFSNVGRACYYTVLEKETGIPFIPNFHTTPAFLYTESLKKEQLFANEIYTKLNSEYENIKKELFKLRNVLDGDNFLQLPPISFQVLNRASKYDEIPEVLMEIRKKYSPLRSRFIELQDVLLSQDISLKKKLKEKQKLFKAINLFDSELKKESTFIMTSFASQINEMSDVGKILEGTSVVGGVKWTKLIDFVIKGAEKLILKIKLRPLYSTKREYLNASTKEIIQVVEKHFGRHLTDNDFSFVNKYSNFSKKGIDKLSAIQ